MNAWDGRKDIGVFSKGRNAEGNDEKSREEDMEF